MNFSLLSILFILTSFAVYANDSQPVNPGEVNITAAVMFIIFVSITLGITYWAAKRHDRQVIFIQPEEVLVVYKMD